MRPNLSRSSQTFRYALTHGWTLQAARFWWSLLRFPPASAYVGEAVRWGLAELADAARRSRPVVWCNVAVPSEFIYGLGAIPIMPEMAAGFAAAWRGSSRLLLRAEGQGFPGDLCSFHRCALGLALEGWLPKPDAVVATSLFCDGAKKLLRYAADRFRVPFFLLDVPYADDDAARQEVAAALREVATALESRHPAFSSRHLPEALALSNQARRHYLEAQALRRHRPAPWRGSEALAYAAVFFMTFGSRGGPRIYRALTEALRARLARGKGAVPREKHRLLWLHFRPFYPNQLMEFLEVEKGAVIAAEEMSYLWWEELDPTRPWESLARKMTSHFLWGPARRRVEALTRMAREYAVDGVAHYSHWGCRQSTGGVRLLQEAFAREGIPFVNLDGDCIDPRNSREGQARTRLEAFLERLEEKQCLPPG